MRQSSFCPPHWSELAIHPSIQPSITLLGLSCVVFNGLGHQGLVWNYPVNINCSVAACQVKATDQVLTQIERQTEINIPFATKDMPRRKSLSDTIHIYHCSISLLIADEQQRTPPAMVSFILSTTTCALHKTHFLDTAPTALVVQSPVQAADYFRGFSWTVSLVHWRTTNHQWPTDRGMSI